MRKIEVKKWTVKLPDGSETEETLLVALNALVSAKKPEEIPKGIDKFRLFGRIAVAFEKADKVGTLMLEEEDYKFLKETVDKDIPSTWGMNKDIKVAIELFLDAKEE